MEVRGMEDVRASLPSIVAELREHPYQAAVRFGPHRREEAVVLSAAEYERLLAAAAQLEDLERLGAIQLVRERLARGRSVEGSVDELFVAADELA
jgi:PHD/YefM family antitoxin component YafN of YafNO toxin-antitoxin module